MSYASLWFAPFSMVSDKVNTIQLPSVSSRFGDINNKFNV